MHRATPVLGFELLLLCSAAVAWPHFVRADDPAPVPIPASGPASGPTSVPALGQTPGKAAAPVPVPPVADQNALPAKSAGGTPAAVPGSVPASAPASAPGSAPGSVPATTPAKPAVPTDAGAPTAPAELPEAVLTLIGGQQVEGILVEQTASRVILKIGNIDTTYGIEQIGTVRLLPTVELRYRQMRSAIEDSDTDQLLSLTEWLVRRRRYELAKVEVDAILKRSPENGPARRMRDMISTQIMLRDAAPNDGAMTLSAASAEATAKPATSAGDAASGDQVPPGLSNFPLLTGEQINLIKVFEVDLTRPPPMTVPRDAMSRVLEQYAGHPLVPGAREGRDAILRQTPVEQLNLLFQLKARDAYGQVKVQGQPESMAKFRDTVLTTFVLNGCATSACHGGLEAGRLVLMNRRPNSDTTVYTDFYILENFRTSSGKPLIDYDNPERSALLQYGLPRADSLAKHPIVPKGENNADAWKPAFKSPSDRRYSDTIAWIKSMYRPRPDYQIDYKPVRPLAPAVVKEEAKPIR